MSADLTYDLLKSLKNVPNILVETGTNFGHTCERLMRDFKEIRTIELSPILYKRALEKFKGTNVKCYFGDSKVILLDVIKDINEPVIFYLDAHYSGGLAARGEEESPLLGELRIISQRVHADIIICDDLRLFGNQGNCGTLGSDQYPLMVFDWTGVTVEACRDALVDFKYEEQRDDRLIFYR